MSRCSSRAGSRATMSRSLSSATSSSSKNSASASSCLSSTASAMARYRAPWPATTPAARGRGGSAGGGWRSVTSTSIACCSSHSASGTRCSSRCSSESAAAPGRLSRIPRSSRNRPAASSRPHSCWVSRGRRAPLVSQMVTGAVLRRAIRATGTQTPSGPGVVLAPARAAQVPGQHRRPPLPLVQHREADVDLGGPAGHAVVGDGKGLAEPPDVVEPQRGVQE